jgi:cytochrome c peroxidase
MMSFSNRLVRNRSLPIVAALSGTFALAVASYGGGLTVFETYFNTAGVHRTFSTLGVIQTQRQTNPFFLPTTVNGSNNGKTCENCHFASNGWGLLVDHANDLFNQTQGLHPLFLPDAADNPAVASDPTQVATVAQRQQAYSLMLNHGLAVVRVNKPTFVDFSVIGVDDSSIPGLSTNTVTVPVSNGGVQTVQAGDPNFYFNYTQTYNNAAFAVNLAQFWFHRRPLPTTNMQFLTEIGWDGRNTPQTKPQTADVRAGISKVSHDTIIARENGTPLPDSTRLALAEQMTVWQLSSTTAQIIDNDSNGVGAGTLMAQGATNGPTFLAAQPFTIGLNDPFSPGFNNFVMSMYNSTAWINAGTSADIREARAKIQRGQALFNSKTFTITGVNGLNDRFGQPSVTATCTTCHNTPNVGNHSSRFDVAIGIANVVFDPATGGRSAPAGIDTDISDFPMFTLQNNSTGEIMRVSDLGLASVTGLWADVGKFKVPVPRNLESRSPYFHNGMPFDIEHLVEFYNQRFNIGFSDAEKSDLAAFLKAL